MDLKGKTPRDVQAGVRMRVWYEEEQDNGTMSRVTYAGRSTQFSRTQGVRVWFDGFPADEQEWINEGDEWEWEDAAPAALQGPFDAVRLRLRGVEQEVPGIDPLRLNQLLDQLEVEQFSVVQKTQGQPSS